MSNKVIHLSTNNNKKYFFIGFGSQEKENRDRHTIEEYQTFLNKIRERKRIKKDCDILWPSKEKNVLELLKRVGKMVSSYYKNYETNSYCKTIEESYNSLIKQWNKQNNTEMLFFVIIEINNGSSELFFD